MKIADAKIPADTAAEDNTPLTECVLKIDASMPESSNKNLIHLATVLDNSSLYDLMIVNLVSLPQRVLVLFSIFIFL